jgi:hypothetical protein
LVSLFFPIWWDQLVLLLCYLCCWNERKFFSWLFKAIRGFFLLLPISRSHESYLMYWLVHIALKQEYIDDLRVKEGRIAERLVVSKFVLVNCTTYMFKSFYLLKFCRHPVPNSSCYGRLQSTNGYLECMRIITVPNSVFIRLLDIGLW